MNKPKTHSKWARAALVVPSAALMLGASEAQTSVGLNFQSWYNGPYGGDTTVGTGKGLQTTGMPVTGSAFGVALNTTSDNWTDATPMESKGGTLESGLIPAVSVPFGGGEDPLTEPPLTATVSAQRTDRGEYTAEGVWGVAAGTQWSYYGQTDIPGSTVVNAITSGDYQVAWGYLTGEGWTVSITGINARFPNGYAVGLIGEGGVKTTSSVVVTENSGSTQIGTITGFTLLPDGLGVGASGELTADAITLTNPAASTNSAEATGLAGIIVTDKPVVMRGPAPFKGLPGSDFTLTAPSVGAGTLTYQWRKDGIAIPGAISPTLAITGATASDSGSYDVVVSSTFGSATSPEAGVAIATPGAVTWDFDSATGGIQDGDGNWTAVAGNPYWWNGTATVDWNNNNLDVATFGAGGSGAYTVTMSDDIDVTGLAFASGTNYTIAGPAKTLTLIGSSTTVDAQDNATIGAMLAGTGDLTKSGTGNLTLTSVASPFSGTVNVTAGTLTLPPTGDSYSAIHASEYNLSPGTTLSMHRSSLGWFGNDNAAGVTINVNGATAHASHAFGVRYVLTGGTVLIGTDAADRLQIGPSGGFAGYVSSKASSTTSVVENQASTRGIWLGTNGSSTATPFTFDTEQGTTASGVDLDIRAQIAGSENSVAPYPVSKTGAGTLKLSGNIRFNGGITVESGKLIVAGVSNTAQSAAGKIWLKDGTSLTVTATGSTAALATAASFDVGTDYSVPAGAQTLSFRGISSTTVAPIRGNTVNLDNPVTINIETPIYDTGDYPLIATDSSANVNATDPPAIGTLPAGMDAELVNDFSGTTKSLLLRVTTASPRPTLVWDGDAATTGSQDGSGAWSQSTSSWWDGSADIPWSNTADYTAVFGSGTTNAYTVTLGDNVSASGLTVNNGAYTIAPGAGTTLTLTNNPEVSLAADTTISAKLAGNTALTKSGSGTLDLTNNANPFSGVINITSGTLKLPTGAGGGQYSAILASRYNLSPGTILSMPAGALGWNGNNNAAGVTINVGEGAISDACFAHGVRYLLTGATVKITNGSYLQLSSTNGFSSYIYSKASATTSVVGSIGNTSIRLGNNTSLAGTFTFDTEQGTTPSGVDMDIRANITGPGVTSVNPIVKTGAGTLKLSGNIDFNGGITVEGGKLIVAGNSNVSQSTNKDIWLKDGTALGVMATGSSPALATGGSFKVGTSYLSPGSAQTLEFVNISSTTVAPIRGVTVNLDNPVVINISGYIPVTGDYPLISTDTSATVNTTTPPVLGTLTPGLVATLVNDFAGPTKSLLLRVTTATPYPSLTWDATGSTTGAQDGSGPWSEAAPATYWWNGTADVPWSNAGGYTAVFGSGTAGTYTVTLGGDVSASGLTVNNGTYTIAPGVGTTLTLTGNPAVTLAANTTIGAKLSGSGTLTKSGSGTLKLTNAVNPFSGVINVTAGTLELPGSGTSAATILATQINLSSGTSLNMPQSSLGWYGNQTAAGVTINVGQGATSGSSYALGIGYVLTGGSVTIQTSRLQLASRAGYLAYLSSKASSVTSVVSSPGSYPIWIGHDQSPQRDFQFDTELGSTTTGVDLDIQVKILDNWGLGCSVTKTGAGTMQLASGNGFYAGLNVNAGTVKLSSNTSLSDNLKVVMNGGKISLASGIEVVKTLYFGTTQQASGTWGATGSGATHIDDTRFTGTGVLQVATGPSYTSWASVNAGGQAMGLDYDKDGVSNGIEYFMGVTGSGMTTNPGVVGGVVSWPKGASYTGVYGTDYVVQTSTDLVSWTNVPSGDSNLTLGSTVSYTLPTGLQKDFVRLKVTGP